MSPIATYAVDRRYFMRDFPTMFLWWSQMEVEGEWWDHFEPIEDEL